MEGNMLAARAHEGDHAFHVEEVSIPQVGAGDVLMKVAATGLTRGVLSLWRARGQMRLLPTILGYEVAGTVAEVGSDVTAVRVGERVRVNPTLSCRNCYYCRTDREPMCPEVSVMGGAVYSERGMPMYRHYHDGGLAQYMKVPDWTLDPLPETISFEVGARIHSLAVAFRALRLTTPLHGSTLVVTGATGGVGSAAVLCAPLFGITRVIAVSRRRETLARTEALAPHLVRIIVTEELAEDWEDTGALTRSIRELAGGDGRDGVDAVVDFMPAQPTVTVQAILSMRKGGTAVLAGGNHNRLLLPYSDIMRNGYTITGSNGYVRRDARELIKLLDARRLDPSPLITHRFALADVNEAADTIWERRGDARFVMVAPPA